MGHGDTLIKPSFFRWALRFGCLNTTMVTGMFVMFIILLTGGLQTTTVMKRMDIGMISMNAKMDKGEKAITKVVTHLKKKFPSNQPEVTTRQILGIIENVHKISARAEFLLNSVKPGSIGGIADRLQVMMGAISPQEIENIKLHLMSIIARADTIVSSIPSDKITNLITTISNLDTNKINKLIDTFSRLHEIKIKI